MLTSPTLLVRAAASGGVLLAVTLLVNVVQAGTSTGALLASAAALAVSVNAVFLLVRPRFEAGLMLGLAAGATALGSTLALTIGMPGSGGPVVGTLQVVLLVLALLVVLVLLLAVRARTRADSTRDPYSL